MDRITVKPLKGITLSDIAEQAERAVAMMGGIRAAMLSPTARKSPPRFNLSQVAALCNVDKGKLSHRMARGASSAWPRRGPGSGNTGVTICGRRARRR